MRRNSLKNRSKKSIRKCSRRRSKQSAKRKYKLSKSKLSKSKLSKRCSPQVSFKYLLQRMQRQNSFSEQDWYIKTYHTFKDFLKENRFYLDIQLTALIPVFIAFTNWMLLKHSSNISKFSGYLTDIKKVEDDMKLFIDRLPMGSWVQKDYMRCKSKNKDRCIADIYAKLCDILLIRLKEFSNVLNTTECVRLLTQYPLMHMSRKLSDSEMKINSETRLLGGPKPKKSFFGFFKK